MRENAVIGGIKKTVARLKTLVSAMEGVGAGAVHAAAEQCAGIARELVPVDTGALKGSICAVSGGRYAASAVASAPYAAMVEYGTGKMAAQPYMMPAAQRTAEIFFENARREAGCAAKEI